MTDTLPTIFSPQGANAREAPCVADASQPSALPRVQRILVADDEEDFRHFLASVLGAAGFDVDAVADGQQAWEALHQERYDLLVTDNQMPRLQGTQLIEQIRSEGMTVPVILASGTCPAENVRNDPQLQIAAVLPKPFGTSDLLDAVRQVLEAPGEDITQHHAAAHQSRSALGPEPASSSLRAPATARQPGASMAAPNRVLIADDDAVVRGSLAAVLESEGYVVDEARNGIEAVRRAIEHLPDLVLLDLNMPHWDGWTAFSQLDRVTPLLPVIVITARPNQYGKAMRLGVDAFMEKPLNIPLLVRAIKRLTNEDKNRHVRRIIKPSFVTKLLGSADS